MLPNTLREVFERDKDRGRQVVPPVFATKAALRPLKEYVVDYGGGDDDEVDLAEKHRDRRRKTAILEISLFWGLGAGWCGFINPKNMVLSRGTLNVAEREGKGFYYSCD
eukprot:GHVQ01035208.1.p1 GENE.GHVQ01035208.1~~GHVQ01035208.1.p1  ORF type:complete len:109 (+),score=14.18 GHVQ01035208.1:138-464(+)